MTTMCTLPRAVMALLLLSMALGCDRDKQPRTAASAPEDVAASYGSSSPPPPWLGKYDDAQQKALNAPIDSPVELAAPRVYPDMSRFTFIGEGPVRVPKDLLSYARLVNQTLEQSPLLYVFRPGPPPDGNLTALYGPPPQPRAELWQRVVNPSSLQPSLAEASPPAEARGLIDEASGKKPPESIDLLRKAAALEPQTPGVHVVLAEAALGAGDDVTAETEAKEALKLDPRCSDAYRVMAEVSVRRNKPADAKQAIARALALYPADERAWKVAEAAVGRPLVANAAVPAPFIEVNPKGAIVVSSCNRPLCKQYALCKAALRYEPSLREAILKEPPNTPYHLSVTEELVCLEAGLGAHLEANESKQPHPDPIAEALIRLAEQKGLTAYAMFEMLGRNRPEWMRVAPEPVHNAVVGYVLERVLGEPGSEPAITPVNGITASTGEPLGL